MNDVEALILHAVGLVVDQSLDVLLDLQEITNDTKVKTEVQFMREMLDIVALSIDNLSKTPDPTDEI